MPVLSLPEKVVEYIGYSDSAMEKAAAFQTRIAAKQAAVAALIPACVDAMVAHERILPTERDKLAELLRDPAQVVELLTKVAGHRNRQEASQLGTPTDGTMKTAAAGGSGHARPYDPASSLTTPLVGVRNTRIKQSDHNFFRGLGLTPPAE